MDPGRLGREFPSTNCSALDHAMRCGIVPGQAGPLPVSNLCILTCPYRGIWRHRVPLVICGRPTHKTHTLDPRRFVSWNVRLPKGTKVDTRRATRQQDQACSQLSMATGKRRRTKPPGCAFPVKWAGEDPRVMDDFRCVKGTCCIWDLRYRFRVFCIRAQGQ
jgi:hypothetical protein